VVLTTRGRLSDQHGVREIWPMGEFHRVFAPRAGLEIA